jgi:peptide/nickel transport system substrate-binding protein
VFIEQGLRWATPVVEPANKARFVARRRKDALHVRCRRLGQDLDGSCAKRGAEGHHALALHEIAHDLVGKAEARDLPPARNAATLLIDHLKQIDIAGELEIIDTSLYYPKILRKDFSVGVNGQTSGPDPDPTLDALYSCGSSVNWDGYCNADVDKMIEQQSIEGDAARRKQILWAIERKLAEDVARPIIFYNRFATCWQPYVKGPTMMVDSIFNSNRREDWWLDK